MKKLILFLFILLPFLATSQVTAPIRLAAKINVFVVTGADPYNLTIAMSDDLSRFTIADISNGDSVYLIDGSDLLIYVVTNRVGSVITVDDPLNTGIQPPTGQGAIISPTVERKYPTYISGLRDDLRSMIMNRFSQLVSKDIALQDEITEYIGISDVAPAVSASSHTGETWRNSVGELYYSDGTSWLTDKEVRISATPLSGSAGRYKFGIDTVGVDTMYVANNGTWRIFQITSGGSVAIPTDHIPYGNGTSITSDTTFRWENKASGYGFDDRYLTLGKKAQGAHGNGDQSLIGIRFKNTYAKPGNNTYSRRASYRPLIFESAQEQPWLSTMLTTWVGFNQDPTTPFGTTDTTWNEGWFLGNNASGSIRQDRPGMHDATEYLWGDGGFDQERHIGQTYVPNLQQGIFNRWGMSGQGNIRRPITFEIQGVNRALTNQVTAIEAHWMDNFVLHAFETSSSYFSAAHDIGNRQSSITIMGGRNSGHGFSMVSDSASGLCRITKLPTYNGAGQYFTLEGWSRYSWVNDQSKSVFSYIRETGDFNFGNNTSGQSYVFNNSTTALNSGFGLSIRGDLTSGLHRNRGSFNVANTSGNSGVWHGFRTDAGFYYISPSDATYHFSSSFRKYNFNQNKSNAKPTQQAFFGMDSESAATLPVLGLYNLVDSIRTFVLNSANPNSVITGKMGDVCHTNDGTNGSIWIKTTGLNTNTGWSQVSTGGGVTTVGAFQNTGTANGLSISGTDIRLHAATETNPGAWNTGDQTIGVGNSLTNEKEIINTVDAGVTKTIKHTNFGGSEGSGVKEVYHVGEGIIGEFQFEVASGGIGNRSILKVKDPSSSLINAAVFTQGTDYSSTEFDAKLKYKITNVTSGTYQVTGKDVIINVPTTATTTTVTLPEIVSGVPAANQVRIGDEIRIIINLSTSVTIQRAGTSDLIWRDGDTSGNTSVSTTGGTYYTKVFLAIGLNEWSVK